MFSAVNRNYGDSKSSLGAILIDMNKPLLLLALLFACNTHPIKEQDMGHWTGEASTDSLTDSTSGPGSTDASTSGETSDGSWGGTGGEETSHGSWGGTGGYDTCYPC